MFTMPIIAIETHLLKSLKTIHPASPPIVPVTPHMKKKSKPTISYFSSSAQILASKNKEQQANFIKNVVDFDTLCQLSDSLSSTTPPLKFAFLGTPLPQKLGDLGASPTLYKPKSLESEINWLFLSIRSYAKDLSIFLLLKKDFEHLFLLGKYEKASVILNNILIQTGYSLWYIESKFLLLEYQNNSQGQKEFLSEINEANKLGKIGTISHFLSFRTERNLSAYKYDSDIKSMFRLNNNKQEKDIREYYMFRLNFFENYNLIDYSHVLLFENANSVIDRYLILRNVLMACALDKDRADLVYSKTRYLFRKTGDTMLVPLLATYDNNLADKDYYNEPYIRILDLYYSGFYEEAIVELKSFLVNEITVDHLVLLANCYINLKKDWQKISDEQSSLLDQMGLKIYNLIANKSDRKALLYSLYQISKNLLSFNIACGIDCFIKEEQNIDLNKKFKYLSLPYFDPYFSSVFNDDKSAIVYLDRGSEFFPGSVSIKFQRDFIYGIVPDATTVSPQVYLINNAKLAFKNSDYHASIFEWSNIIRLFPDNAPIIQTSLKFWFQCLVNLEEYNQAIELFVNNFLTIQNSVNKIVTKDLLTKLRKIRYKGIKRTINLPIFVTLTSHDDIEKSFILEQYCKIYNKKKPSELFDEALDVNQRKVELFYRNACSIDTLKHSIHINNTVERLTERLSIMNYLIEAIPQNKDTYIEEQDLISNELIIYEGMQKLEDSKIYANDQAIINHELSEIEGLFNRFKTIYKLL